MTKRTTVSTVSRNGNDLLRLTTAAVATALVFLFTFLIRVPTVLGYIHLGDGFILLGAAMLGPAAIGAAAVGSMLADLLGGYTMYILPTFLIKGAVAAVAVWCCAKKRPMWMQVLLLIVAEGVMVAGYFVVEWLMLGYGWAAAIGAVIPNLVQGASGVIIAAVLNPLIQKLPLGNVRK